MTYAEFDVLSLGSQFGRHFMSRPNQQKHIQEQAYFSTNGVKDSGHFRIVGGEFNHILLFLEGLYDPVVGEMYLIGCRDVRAFIQCTNNGKFTNLEGGMDCVVEVRIKYTPGNDGGCNTR